MVPSSARAVVDGVAKAKAANATNAARMADDSFMEFVPRNGESTATKRLSRAWPIVTEARDAQSLFTASRLRLRNGISARFGFEPTGHSRHIIHDRGMKPRAPPNC